MYRTFLTNAVDNRIHNPLGPFSFMNLNFLTTFAQPRDTFFGYIRQSFKVWGETTTYSRYHKNAH